MTIYIISQIFVIINYSIIASTYYVSSRKKILILNICNTLAEMIADLLLGAYTGIAMCVVAIIRNLYFYKDEQKNGKKEKNTKKDVVALIAFYIIIIVLTIFTYDGFLSLLIVFATFIYTFAVWQKSTLIYKILGVPNQLLYIAYNFSIKSIFGVILESILLICSLTGYFLEYRKRKKLYNKS